MIGFYAFSFYLLLFQQQFCLACITKGKPSQNSAINISARSARMAIEQHLRLIGSAG